MHQQITPLPSDHIKFLVGLDGNEPRGLDHWYRRATPSQTRCAIGINSHYPELQGGFYINRGLIALAQEALASLGLRVVWSEIYRFDGLCPSELPGCLLLDEHYVVIDAQQQAKGHLFVWKLSTNGGGSFYDNAVILDMLLETTFVEQLGHALCTRGCYAHSAL